MPVIEILDPNFWFSAGPLDALHTIDPIFGSILQFISIICHFLASTTFFLVLISFTYAFFRPKLAIELALALLTSGIIISLAKFYFESPRPFPYPEVYNEKAFGLPSGHAYLGVVIWGLLAYRIKHNLFRILCFMIIFSTPFSRMYLRVHFLGDVVLGLLLGCIHLAIILLILRRLDQKTFTHYFIKTDKHRTLSLLGMVVTISIILLDSRSLSSEHFHSLESAMTSAGALAGFWMGLLFYPKFSKAHFLDWGFPLSPSGLVSLKTLAIRGLVLISILFIFYILPGQLIKTTVWKDDLFLRYFRYYLIGFSLVCLYPIIMQNIASGKYLLKVKDEKN